MTRIAVIGGRRTGRNLAAVRMSIEADQQAAIEAARTLVLTAAADELRAGEIIFMDEEAYRIVGSGPGAMQHMIEMVSRQQIVVEPRAPAPQFGSARPYLKRKKGRS